MIISFASQDWILWFFHVDSQPSFVDLIGDLIQGLLITEGSNCVWFSIWRVQTKKHQFRSADCGDGRLLLHPKGSDDHWVCGSWREDRGWRPGQQRPRFVTCLAILASYYSLQSVYNATCHMLVIIQYSVGDSTIFACLNRFSNTLTLEYYINLQRTFRNSTICNDSSNFSCQIRNQHVWKPKNT